MSDQEEAVIQPACGQLVCSVDQVLTHFDKHDDNEDDITMKMTIMMTMVSGDDNDDIIIK